MTELKRSDLLSMGFYEKSRFTGSIGNLNYILEKKNEEGQPPLLLCTYFPGPYCSDKTPDELKKTHEEEYSEEGFVRMTEFLNETAARTGMELTDEELDQVAGGPALPAGVNLY
ncbi:MAG: hypothetical protein II745_04300 [Lachnospiraceae bacterium]|jgi:hypothetical protein|nr:hypothetical protein [Lachnospiraceae bacterium]